MVPEAAGYMRCYCSNPACMQEYLDQATFEQHLVEACQYDWLGDVRFYHIILVFELTK